MKRRNVLIAAMLIGLLSMVSVNAAAQKKRVKSPEATKTKKVASSEATKTKKIVVSETALPAMLLSKAKELELTESQQTQLMAIMKEMQTKTMAVLTKAQVAKVKTWKPESKMAQKTKFPLSAESAEPAVEKTTIAKAPEDTKKQAEK